MSTAADAPTPRTPDAAPAEQAGQHAQAVRAVTAQTTVETVEQAEQLAGRVLQARLAACVQLGAVRSFFRWEGQVQDEPEQLLTMKTSAAAVPRLRELIAAEHPYDEPEFIVQPVVDGSTSYLAWVHESTGPPD